MSQPIISVIVPIYNREKLISRLLESILPQLSNKVELILIDDGSTDDTLRICENFANESPFVRVIHKENGGVSSARNVGIENAKGLYISFADSDDMLEIGAYKKLIDIIQCCEPDIIDFGARYGDSQGRIWSNAFNEIEKNCLLDKTYILNYIIPPTINLNGDIGKHVSPFLWTKLFKTDIIIKNGIRFDESRYTWEDLPFIVYCLNYANSFYSMNEYLYRCIGTPNSLSSKYTVDYFNIILDNYRLYKALFIKEYNFETQYVYDYWSNAIHKMVFRALEQDSNFEKNRSFIDKALLSDEMQKWVKNSSKNTRFLKNISNAILRQDLDKVYCFYQKEYKKRKSTNLVKRIKELLVKVKRKMLKNG